VLAWIDLEMTGLDPARNVIVEIATIVTDDELKIVAEGPDLVLGATREQLEAMDDVVRRMHTTSGLLTAIGKSTVTVEDATAATLEFLKSQLPTAGSVPLCGNSIAMDRSFLRQYMPAVDDYFHYRTIDVSTRSSASAGTATSTERGRKSSRRTGRSTTSARASRS
jgi:oligoribonuclease